MNVIDTIKNYEFYDGNKRPNKLSASQVFGMDMLELYLAATQEPEKGVFGKGEIGSIFHLGMEEMFKSHQMVKEGKAVQEERFSKTLPNGWIIDGKMDMVDFNNHVIYDWKTMSASKYAELRKNKKDHKINLQMAVYNWLLGGDFEAEAHCFITDWDPCNDKHPATAYQVVKIDMYDSTTIEEMMLLRTDELSDYLAARKIPPKCENVMPRRLKNGTFINSKCMYYCAYSHVCKRKRDDSATKLGLAWGRK